MSINDLIIYILVFFMILGALDKCIGNKFGLGEKFDEGFKAMGPLAIAMVGVISLAPVLADFLGKIIGPIYSFFGADPAMFAPSFLAIDMGGYPLAVQMAQTTEAGLFAGIILGSMLGATVVFTIPVALNIIKKEDHKFLAIGVLTGLITIPFGCLVGGLVAGFALKMILINLIPIIIIALLISLGLWLIPATMIRGFRWFGQIVLIVITLATAAIVTETLTGLVIIPGLAPIQDGIKVVGSITIVLLGTFPFIHVITKFFQKLLMKVGKIININSESAAGLIVTLANNIPMFNMMKNMDDRGKVLNVAFTVSAAFVFGDHLGFTAAVSRPMIVPMIAGKLTAGFFAVILAYLLISRTNILNPKQKVS
ncbi:MAG: ethanolamine utilization protein EutH [Candidatus Kerfeldbacteria bacterium CG_4_10_14_0_8_um_filter_42_10]|uniref:Ethanolamine utilization protein EutH n=1 Tax=Candidatus Kerfeldbacteria bacterium CG_4_10_14_0_8_um_filter_42_10 TaxID=2014248 RepID=A0A2M7RJA9_9BACT|nr:MAG: ethanolamine utilization protein EutH [Candidatus Kerfeldbacteria bacterium CG_4_10_14_0_8_um_filter_42_10]